MSMPVSFPDHVALLAAYLDRRGLIVGAVERQVLNVQEFGLSKVVLTACLARGRDAVISDVPASLVARLRCTCPEIIAA